MKEMDIQRKNGYLNQNNNNCSEERYYTKGGHLDEKIAYFANEKLLKQKL